MRASPRYARTEGPPHCKTNLGWLYAEDVLVLRVLVTSALSLAACRFDTSGAAGTGPASDGSSMIDAFFPAVDAGSDAVRSDAAMGTDASCSTSCAVAGPCCEESCSGSACSVACTQTNQNCTFHCNGTSMCTVNCSGGSKCTLDGSGISTADLTCSGGASCQFDCSNASSCSASCTGNSHCVLICGGGGNCDFSQCNGGATDCGNNVIVCGRSCP